MMENLDPLQRLLMHEYGKKIEEKDKVKEEGRKAMRKRHKSLEMERIMESPEKGARKLTHDRINLKKSFS